MGNRWGRSGNSTAGNMCLKPASTLSGQFPFFYPPSFPPDSFNPLVYLAAAGPHTSHRLHLAAVLLGSLALHYSPDSGPLSITLEDISATENKLNFVEKLL